jgi:hypothetical protein
LIVFGSEPTLPVPPAASGETAFNGRGRVKRLLIAFGAIGVVASTIPAMLRQFRRSRRGVGVRPIADDASDFGRMDDDGGLARGAAAPMSSAASIVPGTREPGMLITFGRVAATTASVPNGPSTMDAVTTAEHQREGGGAPSQRRPVRAPLRWTDRSGTLPE